MPKQTPILNHSHPSITGRMKAVERFVEDMSHKFFGNGQEGLFVKLARLEENVVTTKNLEEMLDVHFKSLQEVIQNEIKIAVQEHTINRHESQQAKEEMARIVSDTGKHQTLVLKRSTDKIPPNFIPFKLWESFMKLNSLFRLYPLVWPVGLFVLWTLGYTIEQSVELLNKLIPLK